MDWLRMLGLALLSAGMVMLLRQMYSPAAAALTITFGTMMLCALLPTLQECASTMGTFLSSVSLGGEYGKVMLKTMGIVLLTQLASSACQEMGAPGIARCAELCGRIALLRVAVPVFISLTQMAVNVLND